MLTALLYARLFFSSTNTPESQFATLWTFGINFWFLLRFRQYYSNAYQTNWKILLFRRVLQIVRSNYPHYKPAIYVHGGEVITELLSSGANVVLVTIHNVISLSIIRPLSELSIESSLIAAGNQLQEEFELLGGNFRLDVIRRSKHSLVAARQKLKQGKWIVCCADEAQGHSGASNGELLMGTGIFDFAKKTKSEILFAVAQVSNNGDIYIKYRQAKVGALSTNEIANKFISFLDTVLVEKKRWKVGKWGDDRFLINEKKA